MHKIFKHLKKYIWSIVAIIVLLAVQAACDLTLPTYTAAIVDTGLQQGGIESSVPEVISKSTMDDLLMWMPQESIETAVKPFFREATAQETEKLGVTVDTEVLVLEKTSDKQLETMGELFDRAFMINSMLNGDSSIDVGAMLAAAGSDVSLETAQQMNPLEIRAGMIAMPQEQREEMLVQIEEKLFSILPDSMLQQAAIVAVKAEYTALGMDLSTIQSQSIWQNGLRMLLIALISCVVSIAVGYFGSTTAAKLGRDLRGKVFHKVIGFSQREMDDFSTASLITRTTNDIQQVQGVMVMLLRMVIYAPIIGIGGILRVRSTNSSMTWVIFVGVLAVLCIVLVLFTFGMPKFKRMQTQLDKVNLVMRETLTGLPVIRAFCTQKREEERFDDASMALTKTQLFVGRLMSGMMPLMMLVMNGISILIMWVGAQGIEAGTMQVGDMMAFIQYTMQIIMAFLMISMMSVMLPRASVSAARIQEVLDTDISVIDPETARSFDDAKRGVIEFKDVSFRYPGADEDMLSHVSFTAQRGQTTAVLGGTGSGKSTLINLIPRFYDVTSGSVEIGGVDVRDVTLEDLRDRIGYVPQQGTLFTGTISENITFGSTDISPEQIQKAAQVAQAEDFIMQRQDGFDDEIAQGGTNVSGGQRQRLSIARAVAKNPDIFVFDDSFSALDFKTDAAVRRALSEAAKDATIIVVAQRISTVLSADQILVLDEGKLVGAGNHQELIQSCDVYRQIALSQLSKEELEDGKKA